MIEDSKIFAEEYRKSPHFIENPLEEQEAIMRSIWEHCEQVKKRFDETDETWRGVEVRMAEFQKTLDSLKDASFWKRIFMTAADKQKMKILEEGIAKITPDMAKRDEEMAKLRTDMENATRMLKVAEANWKKGLNS